MVDRESVLYIMMENPLEISQQKQPLRDLVFLFLIKEGESWVMELYRLT